MVKVSDVTPPWMEVMEFCGNQVPFKVDTGADVTVISESTYHGLANKPSLEPCSSILYSPGGKLMVLGMVKGNIK